jgi:hypothetical protein
MTAKRDELLVFERIANLDDEPLASSKETVEKETHCR